MNLILKITAALYLLFAQNQYALAETQWILGAGLGHFSANTYIGSSDIETINSPIPYFKIKTELFDMSKSDVQMNWFKHTKFRLSVNYDFSLPVDSEDSNLRQDMVDLDPVLKIGPMLSYQLSDNNVLSWTLEAPILYAFKADGLDLNAIGWNISPRISANLKLNQKKSPLELTWSLGPVYGNEDYHQFYYSVNSKDATSSRNEYQAKEGFAGHRFNFSMTKRVDDLWFGLYVRHQNLSGAVFNDSPLVKEKNYWLITMGVSWLFAGNM